MKRPYVLLAIVTVFVCNAWALPPDAVLDKLGGALNLLDAPTVEAQFYMITHFTISDMAGKPLQIVEQKDRITTIPGKPATRETVSKLSTNKNGNETDATSSASRPGKAASSSGWKLVFPYGEDASLFAFGPVRNEAAFLASDFSPISPLPKGAKDGLTQGTLVWNPSTGLPVRMVMTPIKPPMFTSAFSLSYRFASIDNFVFAESISLKGEAGVLFIKRKFDSITTIVDFKMIKKP
jgi:hypothetical protein